MLTHSSLSVQMLLCGPREGKAAGQWVRSVHLLAGFGGVCVYRRWVCTFRVCVCVCVCVCLEGGSAPFLVCVSLWPAGGAGAPETSWFSGISLPTKGLRLLRIPLGGLF